MSWLIGYVVVIRDILAHRICGGSSDMWGLLGDVVANRICGDSSDMWWLIEDEVSHRVNNRLKMKDRLAKSS